MAENTAAFQRVSIAGDKSELDEYLTNGQADKLAPYVQDGVVLKLVCRDNGGMAEVHLRAKCVICGETVDSYVIPARHTEGGARTAETLIWVFQGDLFEHRKRRHRG